MSVSLAGSMLVCQQSKEIFVKFLLYMQSVANSCCRMITLTTVVWSFWSQIKREINVTNSNLSKYTIFLLSNNNNININKNNNS